MQTAVRSALRQPAAALPSLPAQCRLPSRHAAPRAATVTVTRTDGTAAFVLQPD